MADAGPRVAVELPGRGFLRVGGPEARAFLQGLVTNDVDRVAPGRAVWAALLTPQGKYLFDFFLLDAGDGSILLDAEGARLEELERRLAMYRLRARVEIGPATGPLAAWAVLPAGAGEAEGAATPLAGVPGVVAAPDPRHPALGWRAIGPAGALAAAAEAAGLETAPFERYDRLRVALGAPDGTRDLAVQKSTLLEANFDELHGVAFDKGCFVGQELTARTKHRGLLKRRLVPVRVEGGPVPPPGTAVLTADGRDAGEVASAAGDLALASLRLEHLGATLRTGTGTVVPVPPVWFTAPEPVET